ncbi:MAG TPA: radical SAM family heme chaperone HemW [Steroidobacteraceae bacterium]|nr:radical SAM family heme chaperone HemW [Steroidobacteraceae bacterium]
MSSLTTPPLSVYVHFPWCVRKCPYCDFNSYTLHGELAEDRYVEAIERDLRVQSEELQGREVRTIFLGGGTPSLFAPRSIERVLEATGAAFSLAPAVEVTLEANPGTIERGRFAEYRSAGVTRVSLGAQSFDAERLRILGRIHSPDETRRAAEELHSAGISNFNLDLMYALPGQDVGAALSDVRAALALSPAHVSHYQLTLEPGTVFAAQPPAALPGEDAAAEMLEACSQLLAEAGFAQYEVSAYARPGQRCQHNLNYWLFGDYVGAGAGAHGKLSFAAAGSIVRTVKARDPRRYLAAGQGSELRRTVPAGELPFEFMLNALRLVEGFEASLFGRRTGLDWRCVSTAVEDLVRRRLLDRRAGRIRPSSLGLRFLNDLLLSFLAQSPKTTGAFGLSTAV